MYLDCLNLCNVSVMHTRTPRVAILSHQELKKIHNTDLIVRGKIHLDTYKFGKLPVCSQFSFFMFVIIPPFFLHAKCGPLTYLHVHCFLFVILLSGRRQGTLCTSGLQPLNCMKAFVSLLLGVLLSYGLMVMLGVLHLDGFMV